MIRVAGNRIQCSAAARIKTNNLCVRTPLTSCLDVLLLIMMSVTVSLLASTAQAQQLSAKDFSFRQGAVENGWWSPERTESIRATPPFRIGIADQIRVPKSQLIPPASEAANYPASSWPDNASGSTSSSEPGYETQRIHPSYLAQGELLIPNRCFPPCSPGTWLGKQSWKTQDPAQA